MRISDWSSDVCSSDLMERDASEVPVTITPSPDCRWRWLDTQNLACNPAAGGKLRAATEYSVQIGTGFTAQDGSTLTSASTHRFVTTLPRVQYASVGEWSAPDMPEVQVRFNQPVTAASEIGRAPV